LVFTRGRQKNIGDYRGGWVGGSEAKKGPGSDLLFDFFYDVVELPSPGNAQKRETKSTKIGFEFFVDLFVKTF
jgi:hypothetical protein